MKKYVIKEDMKELFSDKIKYHIDTLEYWKSIGLTEKVLTEVEETEILIHYGIGDGDKIIKSGYHKKASNLIFRVTFTNTTEEQHKKISDDNNVFKLMSAIHEDAETYFNMIINEEDNV
jgi:hypothetical protein